MSPSDIPEAWINIVNDLGGSSKSMAPTAEFYEVDDMDAKFCEYLDSQIFECVACGWWYDQDDMGDDPDGEWKCSDCVEADDG